MQGRTRDAREGKARPQRSIPCTPKLFHAPPPVSPYGTSLAPTPLSTGSIIRKR
ncbi:UNVERIFIED_ORG: hypothetical protein QOE_4058 [Clostridioides difficile F501]|nr:hypothetical protein HMPREF9404_3182 [Eggerthella sp. HGA1]